MKTAKTKTRRRGKPFVFPDSKPCKDCGQKFDRKAKRAIWQPCAMHLEAHAVLFGPVL